MSSFKIATICMPSKSNELEKNLSKAFRLATNAVRSGAEIIVFPELFDSGYCVQNNDSAFAIDFSNPTHSTTFKQMLAFTQKYKVFLVASCIEKEADNLYDTAFILSHKGLVGKYRKIYLWGEEVHRFKRGSEYPIFDLEFKNFSVKVGLQICYEIGFSEGARILSLKGAEVLICPSAFGKARTYAWDIATRARALENGIFVVAANQSGKDFNVSTNKYLSFAGKARIINPKGKVLKETTQSTEVIIARVKLNKVSKQREAIPYLRDLNLSLVQQYMQEIQNKKHSS